MSEPIIAQQFWIQSPGHGEIRQAALGELLDGEVLVKARYCAIPGRRVSGTGEIRLLQCR